MKNVALLNESNIVLNIIVVKDDFNQQNYVEYSDDNPAFIGGDFYEGYFYPPQPYLSWVRLNGTWQPPTPKPMGVFSYWDEDSLSWTEVETP
jgi:hypothetical protein